MERFLAMSQPRSRSLPRTQPTVEKAEADKMADGSLPHRHRSVSPASSADEVSIDQAHARIAAAVAELLKPTITAAVESAIHRSMSQLRTDLTVQAKSLKEAEQRISLLEDDLLEAQAALGRFDSFTQLLQNKIDDLENRSRRNNLRIVGLPESFKPAELGGLCSSIIPLVLGISSPCVVERAHRLGPPRDGTASPRPVIVRYLNYADRLLILQKYRLARKLEVRGHNLLLFADYSVEVAKKIKAFTPLCSILIQKQIRFTLAYPAVLLFSTPEGRRYTFQDPDEARSFLNQMEEKSGSPSPPSAAASPLLVVNRSPSKTSRSNKRAQGTPRKTRKR